MAEPLLKPTERRRIEEAIHHCSRCQRNIEALKALGEDVRDLEDRRLAAERQLEGALAVDKAYSQDQSKFS